MRFSAIDEALDWIYSFINLERDLDKRKRSEFYGLTPVAKLCENLGNPQNYYPSIHIAGSKGKGTVSFLLSSYYIKCKKKVGLYTSPHILKVNERIMIDNNPIGDDDFLTYLEPIYNYVINIKEKFEKPSFFDIFTALAFYYFKVKQVDIAIIETGLGGRLDSTNILNPLCSIITNICLEHTEILGKTIKKIAYEKAGIIKKGKPVIVGRNKKIARKQISKKAKNTHSRFYYAPDYIKVRSEKESIINDQIYSQYEIYLKRNRKRIQQSSRLIGLFQNENIETFYLSALVSEKSLGGLLKEDLFLQVIKDAYWPGRLNSKIVSSKLFLVDGAHTPEAIIKLVKTIIRFRKEKIIQGDIAVIVGMMKDKNHIGMLKNLLKISSRFYFVELDKWKDSKVDNYIDSFKKLLHDHRKENGTIFEVIKGLDWTSNEIIKKIENDYPEARCILITGSLYIVSRFVNYLE